MKKLKMLLAVLLTLSMVLGMASVVMAADGSSSDPYVLGTDSMISFSANGTVLLSMITVTLGMCLFAAVKGIVGRLSTVMVPWNAVHME